MPPSSRPDTLHAAAVATAVGKSYRGDGYTRVVMQITGLTTGTITWEASVNGSTWVGILAAPPSTGTGALTATANGAFVMAAWPYLRANLTAWSSGATTVVAAGMP